MKTLLHLTPLALALGLLVTPASRANVSHGSPEGATNYYGSLSRKLGFSTPDKIFATTLDDVATYLGYAGLTGADLQNLPSEVLMTPDLLLGTNGVAKKNVVLASMGTIPIRPDDILVSRFFAPKIMNIRDPEATRRLGWRKLVRLRARPGSQAQAKHIGSGIILFNIFTQPGTTPFGPADESVNTQVMLVTDAGSVPRPGRTGLDTLYWLDYDKLSNGGQLSLALHASFDANELPPSVDGAQDYYVPDGCVACHGINPNRAMVNYLDTDHWFDRLDTDFTALKAQGLALLFDAQTNDSSALSFKFAFDTIRRFNLEADDQAARAQPKHDEVLAAQKWVEIHQDNNSHVQPADRAIGTRSCWSTQSTNDVALLAALNQYCFRCHGTVKFSVFNKQSVLDRRALIRERITPDEPIGLRMPPDRDLPANIRSLILDLTK